MVSGRTLWAIQWLPIVAALLCISCVPAPLVEPPSPATIRIERTWTRQVEGQVYEGTAASLGTSVGTGLLITHNHFGQLPPRLLREAIVLSDAAANRLVLKPDDTQLLFVSRYTVVMFLARDVPVPKAHIARLDKIRRLSAGDWLDVNYWDDVRHCLTQQAFQITSVDDDLAVLADPAHVINPGDSGGGAYCDGELVGCVVSMNCGEDKQSAGSFNVALLPVLFTALDLK